MYNINLLVELIGIQKLLVNQVNNKLLKVVVNSC